MRNCTKDDYSDTLWSVGVPEINTRNSNVVLVLVLHTCITTLHFMSVALVFINMGVVSCPMSRIPGALCQEYMAHNEMAFKAL